MTREELSWAFDVLIRWGEVRVDTYADASALAAHAVRAGWPEPTIAEDLDGFVVVLQPTGRAA